MATKKQPKESNLALVGKTHTPKPQARKSNTKKSTCKTADKKQSSKTKAKGNKAHEIKRIHTQDGKVILIMK